MYVGVYVCMYIISQSIRWMSENDWFEKHPLIQTTRVRLQQMSLGFSWESLAMLVGDMFVSAYISHDNDLKEK